MSLCTQSFCGSGLTRGHLGFQSDQSQQLDQLQNLQNPLAKFFLVAERKLCTCLHPTHPRQHVISWFSLDSLKTQLALLLPAASLSTSTLTPHFLLSTNQTATKIPVYFLGTLEDGPSPTPYFALDFSSITHDPNWQQTTLVPKLDLALPLKFTDLRTLLPVLDPHDLGLAGHACALSQWHTSHQFCGRCGAGTIPIEGGAKRQCTGEPSHRHYPRTDPVIIALVQSPDGKKSLLGRSKKLPRGMLTCLSGFVDQVESVEEAVRREVMEEAGVRVGAVSILGTQPWPIGRGGSCELMIGCICQALSDTLHVNMDEMDECRWVDVAKLSIALDASSTAATSGTHHPPTTHINKQHGGVPVTSNIPGVDQSQEGKKAGQGATQISKNILSDTDSNIDDVFYVPPPFAIAHHLIKVWVEAGGGWKFVGVEASTAAQHRQSNL